MSKVVLYGADDKPIQIVGGSQTALYRPQGDMQQLAAYSGRRNPILTLLKMEEMLLDPAIRLGLAFLKAPVRKATLIIKSKNPALREWLATNIRKFWRLPLRKVMRGFEYGFSGCEVLYEMADDSEGNKKIFIKGLKDFAPRDTRPLTYEGQIAGLRVKCPTNFDNASVGGNVDLLGPKALWYAHDMRSGNWYGRSVLVGTQSTYEERSGKDGALDSRFHWYYRHAFRGPTVRYPTQNFVKQGADQSVTYLSGRDIAAEVATMGKNGQAMILPSMKDKDGNEMFTIDWPQNSTSSGFDIRDYCKDLRAETWNGLEIPDEIIAAEGTGALAGRRIPERAFYSSREDELNEIIDFFEPQVLKPMAMVNYGKDAQYELMIGEIAPTEQGDGQDEPGGPGEPGGGKPPGGNPFGDWLAPQGGEGDEEKPTKMSSPLLRDRVNRWQRVMADDEKALVMGTQLVDPDRPAAVSVGVRLSTPGAGGQPSIAGQEMIDPIAKLATERGLALSKELRSRLVRMVTRNAMLSPTEFLRAAARIISQYQPRLAALVKDTLVAAWIMGAKRGALHIPNETLEQLEDSTTAEGAFTHGLEMHAITPPPPPSVTVAFYEPGERPSVVFPQIEEAFADLQARKILDAADFYKLGDQARTASFTVSYVNGTDTLETIRDRLADAVTSGGTLADFTEAIGGAMDASPLGEAHVETVFRNNIQTATSAGQEQVINDPLVRDAFPYAIYDGVADTRQRETHNEMMHAGIPINGRGSNVYRSDDPIWNIWTPPNGHRCRCGKTFITLRQAARLGVPEAKEWLATGTPPVAPWYSPTPMQPDPGFASRPSVGGGTSVGLSRPMVRYDVTAHRAMVLGGRVYHAGDAVPLGALDAEADCARYFAPVRLSVMHAPTGGITVNGKEYSGGQFIPSGEQGAAKAEAEQTIKQVKDTHDGYSFKTTSRSEQLATMQRLGYGKEEAAALVSSIGKAARDDAAQMYEDAVHGAPIHKIANAEVAESDERNAKDESLSADQLSAWFAHDEDHFHDQLTERLKSAGLSSSKAARVAVAAADNVKDGLADDAAKLIADAIPKPKPEPTPEPEPEPKQGAKAETKAGGKFYHGTWTPHTGFRKERGTFFISDDESYAKSYQRDGGDFLHLEVKPDANILDTRTPEGMQVAREIIEAHHSMGYNGADDFIGRKFKNGLPSWGASDLIDEVKARGFDGLHVSERHGEDGPVTSIAVFNPDVVETVKHEVGGAAKPGESEDSPAESKATDSAKTLTRANHKEHLWEAMNKAWDDGQTLHVPTMTKVLVVEPKHRDALRFKNGELQARRGHGDKWDAIIGQSVDSLSKQTGIPMPLDIPFTPEEEARYKTQQEEALRQEILDDQSHTRWQNFVKNKFDGNYGNALDAMEAAGFADAEADKFIAATMVGATGPRATITDVTPDGYGPGDATESEPDKHLTTEEQRLRASIDEGNTILRGGHDDATARAVQNSQNALDEIQNENYRAFAEKRRRDGLPPATLKQWQNGDTDNARHVVSNATLFKRTGEQFEEIQKSLGIAKPKMGQPGADAVRKALDARPGGPVIAALLGVHEDATDTMQRHGFNTIGDATHAAIDGKFTGEQLLDASRWAAAHDSPDVNRFLRDSIRTATPTDGPIADMGHAKAGQAGQLDRLAAKQSAETRKEAAAIMAGAVNPDQRKDGDEPPSAARAAAMAKQKAAEAVVAPDAPVLPVAPTPPVRERELSDQEKASQEYAENFGRVSADPTAAKSRDLHRAIGFLHDEDQRNRKRLELGRLTPEQLQDRIYSADTERQWYGRILKERGDYAGGGPYSDERPKKVPEPTPGSGAFRPKGVPGEQMGLFDIDKGGQRRLFNVEKPKKVAGSVDKPTASLLEKIGDDIDAKQAESSPLPSQADLFGDSDDTPRERATKQQAIDSDYEFARKSAVPNVGEDIGDSARHKRNAWRGLEGAEADGTAETLVTRDNLLKNEPHELMTHADAHPLTALAMHHALKAFPPKPTLLDPRVRGGVGGLAKTPADVRKDYVEAYRELKSEAERLAATEPNAIKAMESMRALTRGIIERLRTRTTKNPEYGFQQSDPYNSTANDLVATYKALWVPARGRAGVNSVAGKVAAFGQEIGAKYPDISEGLKKMPEHAKDIMEGKSMPATFGKSATKEKGFDPAEMYVKIATRAGGRDVSKHVSSGPVAARYLADNFKLRGVQWGNSVTDDEREHHAAKTVEALTDLADVLGIKPEDVSLGGKLAIAIGARGRGRALAHYEPSGQTINLTRAKGVGSLAHEWGHAFDHQLEDFQIGSRSARYHSQVYDSKLGMADVHRAFRDSGFDDRLDGEIRDRVVGGSMSNEKSTYWRSSEEKFARCFERYVQRKLERAGAKNTYLSGIETKAYKSGGLWPTDEEADAMAPAFDALFAAFRKRKYGDEQPVKLSRRERRRSINRLYRGGASE